MEIQIQPALLNDLKQILQLQKDCYQSEAKIYDNFDIPPLTQSLKSLEEDFNRQTILKAELGGKLVASVRAFRENGTCFIGRLIVKEDFQNRGIGRKMMKAIEAVFSDCYRYELFTGFKSVKNLNLYHKLGYREFKRHKENEKLTIVFFEKIKR
ncbi:GNAT family N-acetyltransferase [Maribellus comscasis]|uniref:GNAT family N-acetyltransferase n=1 Tax=Maribellus comscasis TaxID=2681766 RepID=A0A6I6K447_9BACT|nr:GNAT family N-acetyltransferase [Maribellus comscasis]QGY47387.1 GNAT family N-acetyltransferase [Maribellus comscasis]